MSVRSVANPAAAGADTPADSVPVMELRIFTEPQQGATYEQLLTVARATEDLGYGAFFRSDHYVSMSGDGLPGTDRRLAHPRGARP